MTARLDEDDYLREQAGRCRHPDFRPGAEVVVAYGSHYRTIEYGMVQEKLKTGIYRVFVPALMNDVYCSPDRMSHSGLTVPGPNEGGIRHRVDDPVWVHFVTHEDDDLEPVPGIIKETVGPELCIVRLSEYDRDVLVPCVTLSPKF